MSSSGVPSGAPRLAARALVVATLPLIFMGGMVTTKGAGMAVPDWPTTFGHNMLLAPWTLWREGGPFIEHTHRLLGATVGLVTIALALAFHLRETRSTVRIAGLLALPAVIGQGVLGGLRVRLEENGLAFVHGCAAQAFFALAVALAVVTSRRWTEAAPPLVLEPSRVRRLRLLSLGLVALVYLQVVLGAVLRHRQDAFLEHLGVAFAVLFVAGIASSAARQSGRLELARGGRILHAALGAQILLGLAAWYLKPLASVDVDLKAAVVTFHVLGGALVLGSAVALALGTFRHVALERSAPLAAGGGEALA